MLVVTHTPTGPLLTTHPPGMDQHPVMTASPSSHVMQPRVVTFILIADAFIPLQFHGKSAGREAEFERRLAEELGPGFKRVRLLWLLANTQHEQTCVAWKAAAPAGAKENGVSGR